MKIDLVERYKSMPKNLSFILSDKFQTYFFGGFANGKTEALCQRAVLLALKFPKAIGLIGRATYPELRDSTIRSFFDVCPPDLIANYHRQDNKVTLKNGAEIIFRAFDDPRKILSMNLGWFGIDQIEEVTEEIYLQLLGRLRDLSCRFAFGVGNPEPGWVKKRFKDTAGTDKDILFLEATTMENPHLPPDYVENLKANYPDFWIKRYVYGDWNTFEGQILTEFIESEHVVFPFEIPKTWQKEYVIDYGYRNPLACLKIAIDYDDNYYVIDEHYEREKIVSYHAQKIKEMGYSKDVSCLIDPSCNAKTRVKNELQVSIIDEFMEEGIFPFPANNNMAGTMRINQWFKENRLKIFRNCTNTINEIKELRWKKVKPDWNKNIPEEEEDKNNHCFVGDTLVTMSDGSGKQIKEVKAGEFVISEDGVRKVIKSWQTKKNADIWRLYLSNGTKIDATAGHNIYTQSGERTLDSLRYKDVVYSLCENTHYSKVRNTDGMVDTFLPLADVQMVGSGCTLRSGRVLMGRFLPDITSITKTLTERITRLITSNVSKGLNTLNFIRLTFPKKQKTEESTYSIKSDTLPQSGTNQKPVVNGTARIARICGRIRSKLNSIANSVAENIQHLFLLAQSIVIPIVTKLTKDQNVWVIGVRNLATKLPVYNLTVDTTHNYYANGILVANSTDCLKYFANNRPQASKKPLPENYQMQVRREQFMKVGKHNVENWYD